MPRLEIQTRGRDGLRYRLRQPDATMSAWRDRPAFELTEIQDPCGAGHWMTAAVIHLMQRCPQFGLDGMSHEQVDALLAAGQACGAWTCQYAGARGGMYDHSPDLEEFVFGLTGRHYPLSVRGAGKPCLEREMTLQDVLREFCPSCRGDWLAANEVHHDTTDMVPDRFLGLVDRIDPKFRRVWDGLSIQHQAALARYFLPHRSTKPKLAPTRPRVLKWYCPFAHQEHFPSGHRYCINVYTGCAHGCLYCYASAYAPAQASVKRDFERQLGKDLDDLEAFDVPPAPVHLSNSTDPFQPLERAHRHTKHSLEQLLRYRSRFTTVTMLTKNPLLPIQDGYLDLFRELTMLPSDHPKYTDFREAGRPAFQVEVSLAFWQESARGFYDPQAPTVRERVEGIQALREAGIPVVLRIDPLFPRSPLPTQPPQSLLDFGLAEAQTLADLESLVDLARDVNVRHVVFSPVKVVQPRGRELSKAMQSLRLVFHALALPGKPAWSAGSWRVPRHIAQDHIIRPFLDICERRSVPAKFCMGNLVETP